MASKVQSMLSLEEELTSVEEGALEEERDNVRHNFSLLESERRSIHIPYPDVGPYDTGVDYSDISDLQ